MNEKQLESGVWIAENPPPPEPPQAEAEFLSCVACGKKSEARTDCPLWFLSIPGFFNENPTCGHGHVISCHECGVQPCPKCGCKEFYC